MANSNKKVSVIIPAKNEGKLLHRTLESIKKASINLSKPVEIIVVVNGSGDKTFKIAKHNADKVLRFKEALGPSLARNEGAKVAEGDAFIFLDADTRVSENAIFEVIKNYNENMVGACSASVSENKKNKRLRAKIFFAFKNFIHKTQVYKGSIALIFCSRKIFFEINGFDKNIWVGELSDFIKRAEETGASYKFLENCYVTTSLRRYEKDGYLKTFLFWIVWKITSIFKKDKEMENKYFKH